MMGLLEIELAARAQEDDEERRRKGQAQKDRDHYFFRKILRPSELLSNFWLSSVRAHGSQA